MKKKYLMLVAGLMLATTSFADDVYIGYCNGNAVDGSERLGSGSTLSVAVGIDKATFPMYKGAKIIGARLGFGADVSDVTVFVKDGLDGTVLYSQKLGPLYEGWNDVSFDKAVTVPDKDIYIGYTCSGNALVGYSGSSFQNGFWVKDGSLWSDSHSSFSGSACIQAVLDGGTYDGKDAALVSVDKAVSGKADKVKISGVFRNNTNETATSLTIDCKVGNSGTVVTKDAKAEDVLPGELGRFSLTIDPVEAVGKHELSLTAKAVNGYSDEWDFNDIAAGEINVYGEIVKKKVLLEYFTGVGCGNCPAGQLQWKQALEGRDDAVWVSHHVGFTPDMYTVDESKNLVCFYNSPTGGTFAPASMLDRRNLSDYGAVTGSGATPGPVFSISAAQYLRMFLDVCAKDLAPVKVEVGNEYDETSRQLVVDVKCTAIEGFDLGESPMLNVYLIENGIVGKQSGVTGDYVHDHVVRKFVTPAWGDELLTDAAGVMEKRYTVQIPKEWNAKNMDIVAFVANYNSADVNDCRVYNTESVEIKFGTSGISNVDCEDLNEGKTAIYNLSGQRISKPVKGIYIVNGKKHVR